MNLCAERYRKAPIIVLGLLLAFSSSGFVQKYSGTAGLAIYAFMVIGILLMLQGFHGKIEAAVQPRFRIISVAIFAALLAGFLGLHHIEDDRGPGRSSDRDEGLELAVSRMLNGENPYYPQNDIAGPLSLLPGAILLSVPFVLTGSAGLQNIFWLGAFLLVATRNSGNRTLALLLLVVSLALSPSAQYEFISGGDMISNGIYVAVFLMLACHFWIRDASLAGKLVSALLLAIGLASRANFILLLPLFGAFIFHESGIRRAIIATAWVMFCYLLLILPFYFYDPAAFTPLMSQDKLSYANRSSPWIDKAIIAVSLLGCAGAAGWLVSQKRKIGLSDLFRCSALITFIPMACVVSCTSIVQGKVDFSFMHDRFGLMYVFLALLGWGTALAGRNKDCPTSFAATPNNPGEIP